MSVLAGANLRTRIFFPVFALACLAGLAYVFSRPAVYVSSARLQIEMPRSQRQQGEGDNAPNLLTAAQALTSSAVLDSVVQRVSGSHPGAVGSTEALRGMLSATPISDTNVIELQGEGRRRELLPLILDAWIEAYRRSRIDNYDRTSTTALDEARNAVQDLQKEVVDKRRELEQFRKKADIVSVERGDNQALSQLQGLNTALNEARNREVKAEARFNAMRENLGAGKSVVPPEDRALISGLEKRAIELREKMKDLEQEFTAPYLAVEPRYQGFARQSRAP